MEKRTLEEVKSDEDREKGGARESRTLTYFARAKTRCDGEFEPDSSGRLPFLNAAPSLTVTLLPWGHMGWKQSL